MGGHLPSAARSNTVPVLFSNYLRGDPTTIEWAHEIVSEAVVDAEQAALAAHRAAQQAAGGGPRILPNQALTDRATPAKTPLGHAAPTPSGTPSRAPSAVRLSWTASTAGIA